MYPHTASQPESAPPERTALRALETLSLAQATGVAELLRTGGARTEDARLILRNAMLVAYRQLLQPVNGSATYHAMVLSDELREGDPSHPHAVLLGLITSLCRGRAAPCPKTIERVMLAAERRAAG